MASEYEINVQEWQLDLMVDPLLVAWRDCVVRGCMTSAPCAPEYNCPHCAPVTAAIESMLLGIRRELDQWQPWEHRCFSRFGYASNRGEWICTCGSTSLLDVESEFCKAIIGFSELFWAQPRLGGDTWHARPGTTITPTTTQPELVRAEVGE